MRLNLNPKPIEGNWYITPHAVEVYQARCAKYYSWEDAKKHLIRASFVARYIKDLHPGIHLYRTGKPQRLRLIVSSRLSGLPQLVTVL